MSKTFKKKLFGRVQPRTFTVALAFILVFGSIGAYFVFFSEAATTSTAHTITSGFSGKCLDDFHNSLARANKADIWDCNGGSAQKWVIIWQSSSGQISLRSGKCLGLNTTTPTNGTLVGLYTCATTTRQQWIQKSNGNLVNIDANKCMTASSSTNGTQLELETCKSPVTNGQKWHNGPSKPPTPAVSFTTPGAGAKVSGSSAQLAAKASVSSGSITNITIVANGATLISCANSTTCSTGWNTTKLKNGAYTIMATAKASGGVSSKVTESVTINNPVPAPKPTPKPGPKPSPNPSPSPSPTPVLSINPPQSPTQTLSVNPKSTNAGSQTLNTTVTNDPDTPAFTDTGGGPAVNDIEATNITPNAISITWQGTNATTYTIKYGTNQHNLTATRTLKTSDAVPSVTLTNLPTGRVIYIEITPSDNGASGTAEEVNFKTRASHSALGAVIIWTLLILAAAIAFIFIMLRRRSKAETATADVDVSDLPLYPREDSAAEASRLNWWQADDQQQTGRQGQDQNPNEPPDMYEEGRKRLEDEENHHQLPKP